MILWDFLGPETDGSRENLIQRWARKEKLSNRDHGNRTIVGPVNKQRHIYKLVVHGDVMLRPMLCKGPPESRSGEMTLLEGAIEKGWKLHPADAAERAERNRLEIERDCHRRGSHERF